jgi:hypothetical protein
MFTTVVRRPAPNARLDRDRTAALRRPGPQFRRRGDWCIGFQRDRDRERFRPLDRGEPEDNLGSVRPAPALVF